jgi:hypothetical protein
VAGRKDVFFWVDEIGRFSGSNDGRLVGGYRRRSDSRRNQDKKEEIIVIQRFFVGNLGNLKERGWELGGMMVESMFNDLTNSRSSEGWGISRRGDIGREVHNMEEQFKLDGTNGVIRKMV